MRRSGGRERIHRELERSLRRRRRIPSRLFLLHCLRRRTLPLRRHHRRRARARRIRRHARRGHSLRRERR